MYTQYTLYSLGLGDSGKITITIFLISTIPIMIISRYLRIFWNMRSFHVQHNKKLKVVQIKIDTNTQKVKVYYKLIIDNCTHVLNQVMEGFLQETLVS